MTEDQTSYLSHKTSILFGPRPMILFCRRLFGVASAGEW